MKELNQFQCEFCNTVYKSKNECMECESWHQLPTQIVANKFKSYKSDGNYPIYVDIQMTDGKVMRYRRG